jgi:thiamine biosynthesis lipoprotein
MVCGGRDMAADVDTNPIRAALQAAVHEVDAQMSTWKPKSDLMVLNSAPVGKGY